MPPNSISLQPPFVMQCQQQTEWCWAANAASISAYFGSGAWTQCLVVNRGLVIDQANIQPNGNLPSNDCCQDGTTNYCNRAGFVDTALKIVSALASYAQGPLAMPAILAQLGPPNSVPIVVRVSFPPNDSGHFVSVTGADAPSNTVHIEDPYYGASDKPLDQFTSSYQGNGTWSWTFYVCRPAAGGGVPPPGGGPPSPGAVPAPGAPTPFTPFLLRDQPTRDKLRDVNREELPVYIADAPSVLRDQGVQSARQIGWESYQQGAESNALEFDMQGKAVTSRRGSHVAGAIAVRRAAGDRNEFRLLRIPELGITVLWDPAAADGGEVIPIDPAPPFLKTGTTYSIPSFLEAITPFAAKRALSGAAESEHMKRLAAEGRGPEEPETP